MYIERMTDEQINNFLKKKYPDYSVSFTRDTKEIYASITNTHSMPDDYTWHERYSDFEATGNNASWIKYLAVLFGAEYKNSYLNRCKKIFD